MSCLLAARYTMLADVWTQTSVQDESGEIERDWTYNRTIECDARGVLGGGIRVVGSTERWAEDFEDISWSKMRTQDDMISKRDRVTNIRDRDSGSLIWKEGASPIEFDVQGVQPVVDPFGQITEYDVLLKGVTGD